MSRRSLVRIQPGASLYKARCAPSQVEERGGDRTPSCPRSATAAYRSFRAWAAAATQALKSLRCSPSSGLRFMLSQARPGAAAP